MQKAATPANRTPPPGTSADPRPVTAISTNMVARIGANPGGDPPLVDAITASAARMAQELGTGLSQVSAMQEALAQTQSDSNDRMGNIMTALTAKKRIIRGPDGRAIGVEVVQ